MNDGGDRISMLADELIHHILSFCDVQLAVQTSLVSKRWKLIWTTLPSLNLTRYDYDPDRDKYFNVRFFRCPFDEIKFFDKFFANRKHESEILKLNIVFPFRPPPNMVEDFISYAISHNVQHLNVDVPGEFKLCSFSSDVIKKLNLSVNMSEFSEDCWVLPALKSLHFGFKTGEFGRHSIIKPRGFVRHSIILPISYLSCLTCLQTLSLDGFDLPISLSLLALTTLKLASCKLFPKVWDFPALSTLVLDDVVFPENTSEFFSTFANLRNLTLIFQTVKMVSCVINCPELVNLEINAWMRTIPSHLRKIVVVAPKIRNFSSVGFFPITFGVSELENVNIKLRGCVEYPVVAPQFISEWKKVKKFCRRVTHMLPGLGSARILTLDFETIEALSDDLNFLVRVPSPFYNLKYVKLPRGYKESSIPTYLKCYLLGRSPKATIVTTLPQEELIPGTLPVCLTAQNLLPEKPLTTQFAWAGNDRASSSRGGGDSGYELWQGHEVNSEFLGLLDCIVKKYPATFDYISNNSKKLCTLKLNMFCTTVKAFLETSMTEVDAKMIAEYRALLANLQRSFNIKWLVDRLNYIEQLEFPKPLLDKLHAVDSRVVDAKLKLHDLQALRMRMLTKIHRDIGTMGTGVAVGYIGDGLFLVTNSLV